MIPDNKIITLYEYEKVCLPRSCITDESGQLLWQKYDGKISVTVPSFKTDDQWELTSLGWVGYIPFSDLLHLHLKSKVPLQSLFGMWEYAYRLNSFHILPELFLCKSMQEFYGQLASILAKRIIDRGRKGFYRTYLSRSEELSYVKGRLDVNRIISKPWDPRPLCHYQENSVDIEDNQIFAWTLYTILRSGYCPESFLPIIRSAYRTISRVISLYPFSPIDCIERFYNRLNKDYEPLHGLCRFFLENTGPSHEVGDRTMIPFLVNMPRLFELFIAEWMKKHLPNQYRLVSQEEFSIGSNYRVAFKMDLVISDALTGKPLIVLDTKYKASDIPSPDDIAKITFYAMAKGCQNAVLVYPSAITQPLDTSVDRIRIRSAAFTLDKDIEESGKEFLASILEGIQD